MKNISIVGTVGLPACYGGFESLVENLVRNCNNDIQYEVFCSGKGYDQYQKQVDGAKLTYLPLSANGIQSVPYDMLSLIKCIISKPDVVLILGVSGCLFLPLFKLFSSAKVVTNIDGLEWKRDKWGKWVKRFLKLSEAFAVKYSDVVVTDNQAITDYVLQEYGISSKTIAYGGDHAVKKQHVAPVIEEEPYALGLCRIEPENNVEMILESYSKTSLALKFVGNWAASDFGRKMKSMYSSFPHIELLDPIYDIDDLYSLRNGCSLYVHGHSAGGTNPSLVEMMHFGTPIYAFDCRFNRYSTEEKAMYFKDSDELVSMLECKIDKAGLESNGKAMQDIAAKRYTWETITHQYESTYL